MCIITVKEQLCLLGHIFLVIPYALRHLDNRDNLIFNRLLHIEGHVVVLKAEAR